VFLALIRVVTNVLDQADVQRLQEIEAKMRAELHDRLERMAMDVENVIQSNESSGEPIEVYETDEL